MGRPAGSKNKGAARKAGRKARANGTTPPPEPREAAGMKPAESAAPAPKANAPTPDETARFLASLTRLKTEAQRISGEISALGRSVKARGGPAYWKALKDVHDLNKLDPDEARAQLEALVTVAAQQDIRITWMGNQATFADIMEQNQPPKNTEGSRDLAEARAEADGYNSGKNGAVPSDNPWRHKPGSPEYVAWHNGRDSGAADAARRNGPQAQRIAGAAEADASLPDDGEEDDDAEERTPEEIADAIQAEEEDAERQPLF